MTRNRTINTIDTEEFPLPLAENWDAMSERADYVVDVIDRHLNFESRLQGRELRPTTICPEQKISMASDLQAVVFGRV